ncbi:copper transporter 6-like [Carya illinoinensis]|uniref:Copper transport protein n=1 Tax=Carya illinoinensis TaxID=32201 RepID=A0A8T1NJT6_CARIL|nr:copper transporter 6-like [Carya illinoinensis]KAG6629147.1 hypothetical protein CIPAW_14G063400 [Carya illinoinensis]KAG6678161.1 hypothetical protein I3842_14G066000 [Carya illinoinensis]
MKTKKNTYFWGNYTEVIFSGWPGQSFSSYILALVLVFVLGFAVEWLSHTKIIKSSCSTDKITAGLLLTGMHGTRVGMAYLAMLAVMSMNVGVLLAAIAGYTVGFFIFGSCVFVNYNAKMSSTSMPFQDDDPDLPPFNC